MVESTHGLGQQRTAIATAFTRADTYRADGQAWRSAQDLPHDTPVDEVNHFGRHTTARGEVLRVSSVDGPIVDVKVLDIRAVETKQLTDADFRTLGYVNYDDYAADWGAAFGDRVWLMRIEQVQP